VTSDYTVCRPYVNGGAGGVEEGHGAGVRQGCFGKRRSRHCSHRERGGLYCAGQFPHDLWV